MALVIDTNTGTVLAAEHCVLLFEEALTSEELDKLESDSDADVSEIGRDKGISVMDNYQLIYKIIETIWPDGPDSQWDSDTVNNIAEIILRYRQIDFLN